MSNKLNNESCVWRTAGGDATRRGLFDQSVVIESRPARHLKARGSVQAPVVFNQEGTAFVADMSGSVQAFDLKGRPRWHVELPGGISASPAVHPAKPQLYVGTHRGWLYALNAAAGTTIWRRQIPTKSDPRILSDLLYLPEADVVMLNSWGGRFCALDAASGDERFSWNAGISPYSGAAADREGNLYCLRAVSKQGVELLRVSARGEESVLHRVPEEKRGARRTLVAAAPVVDEERGVVYFPANRDQSALLHAWSVKSNGLLWTRPLPSCVQATPALRKDGVLLVADLGGFVRGVGPDGTVRFRYETGSEYLLAGGVSEAGGTCFIGDPLGVLHAIDSQGGGRRVFEATRGIQARPAFDPNGNLYVPTTDKSVCVFSARPS